MSPWGPGWRGKLKAAPCGAKPTGKRGFLSHNERYQLCRGSSRQSWTTFKPPSDSIGQLRDARAPAGAAPEGWVGRTFGSLGPGVPKTTGPLRAVRTEPPEVSIAAGGLVS